jgi:hypothetical protein
VLAQSPVKSGSAIVSNSAPILRLSAGSCHQRKSSYSLASELSSATGVWVFSSSAKMLANRRGAVIGQASSSTSSSGRVPSSVRSLALSSRVALSSWDAESKHPSSTFSQAGARGIAVAGERAMGRQQRAAQPTYHDQSSFCALRALLDCQLSQAWRQIAQCRA